MVRIGIIGSMERIRSTMNYFRTTEGIVISGVLCNDQTCEEQGGIRTANDYTQLIEWSDAIYILSCAQDQYETSVQSFRQGKHVFLEQISTLSVDQIEQLLKSRKEANVKCIIGSQELCHPAFLAIKKQTASPLFIVSQRNVVFDPENTKNIILELMMKDIAVVLNLAKSDIKRIWANGHKIMSEQTDVANARLEFSNGCVAVLAVDKNASHTKSHLKIYTEKNILSIDFELNRTSILHHPLNDQRILTSIDLPLEETDPFRYQLENFRDSILTNADPLLKLREGYKKLDIAHKILKKILSSGEE